MMMYKNKIENAQNLTWNNVILDDTDKIKTKKDKFPYKIKWSQMTKEKKKTKLKMDKYPYKEVWTRMTTDGMIENNGNINGQNTIQKY